MNSENNNLNDIISIFGEKNENILEDDLEIIYEEINSIDDINTRYELAIFSIILGKHQVLSIILSISIITSDQIFSLKKVVSEREVDTYQTDSKNKNINEIFDKLLNEYKCIKKVWD
jgi:hypothetical protein